MKKLVFGMNSRQLGFGVIIGLLLVVGAFLRFYDIGSQPYWMDEGYTINAVLAISEKGESVLDSGLPYACPLYCYPTATLADDWGHTAENYRLPAASMGILFILVIYMIATRWFSSTIGLLTATFTTFAYFHIAWSRQARWYTLFTVVFWLALYTFYRAYYQKEKRLLFSLLTILFTTLTILTHGLGYALPFIMTAWILVDQFLIKKRLAFKTLIVVVSGLGLIILLLDALLGKDTFRYTVTHLELHNILPYYLSFYIRTYWLFIPFVITALAFPPPAYRKAIYLLGVSFLGYLIPLSFLTSILHYRYLFHLTPIFFILGAIGMTIIYTKLKGTFFRATFVTGIILLFITIGGGVIIPQSLYTLETDNPAVERTFPGTAGYYAYTPQPDWNSAYAYIEQNRAPDDIIISSHAHFTKIFLHEPGYWLGYNYLGMSDLPSTTKNDREYYVGAEVIDNLADLMQSTQDKSGYIIFDYMAVDGRIAEDTLTYIRQNLPLVYHKRVNEASQIWIYRFEKTDQN